MKKALFNKKISLIDFKSFEDSNKFAVGPISNRDSEKLKDVIGKNHFIPNGTRDLFIGKCVNGYYATSHIKGKYRRYRCKNWNESSELNIFASGPTAEIALDNWLTNYQVGIFNIW